LPSGMDNHAPKVVVITAAQAKFWHVVGGLYM
jgi:hypothetical protein